jgi:hypothetical protein
MLPEQKADLLLQLMLLVGVSRGGTLMPMSETLRGWCMMSCYQAAQLSVVSQ